MNALVESLKDRHILKTEEVIRVFQSVDRALYLDDLSFQPYQDRPRYIGYQATISAPHMHAFALELMHPYLKRQDSNGLDIGSGSGYLTACMGLLSTGRVIGIDHIPQLVEKANLNIKNDPVANSLLDKPDRFTLQIADGRQGLPDYGPYDVIHIGAAMVRVPDSLISQLKPSSLLLAPIGDTVQQFTAIRKSAQGALSEEVLFDVSYIPLTSATEQLNAHLFD